MKGIELSLEYYLMKVFWGHAPKPPGSASPRYGHGTVFCEAELALEKEEYYPTQSNIDMRLSSTKQN
jgi:hypothetical protein